MLDFRVQHLETLENKRKGFKKNYFESGLVLFPVLLQLRHILAHLFFFLVTFQPPQQLPANAKKPLSLFVNCF